MKSRTFPRLLVAALLLGITIACMEVHGSGGGTGFTTGLIFVSTLIFGFLSPKFPLLWAFAVGGWIPLVGLLIVHNPNSVLALIVAMIGACAGALAKKVFTAFQTAFT